MKKEAIQSRNRKLSIKSRRRRRARSASAGNTMAITSSAKYNSDRSPTQMLFNLPPAAGSLPCGLVGPAGSGLSVEQRPYYSGRYYVGASPNHIARYATSGCAAMMGQAGHVTPWGTSSPYHHFAGPCASSGIITAMV